MPVFEDDRREQLRRAVVISLLSWRRAEADDPLDDAERFGWWGDSLPPVQGALLGSRLWLLRRAKLTAETIARARSYCDEALEWLVGDGHAAAVDVTLERVGVDALRCRVDLTLSDGVPLSVDLDNLWRVINGL